MFQNNTHITKEKQSRKAIIEQKREKQNENNTKILTNDNKPISKRVIILYIILFILYYRTNVCLMCE